MKVSTKTILSVYVTITFILWFYDLWMCVECMVFSVEAVLGLILAFVLFGVPTGILLLIWENEMSLKKTLKVIGTILALALILYWSLPLFYSGRIIN